MKEIGSGELRPVAVADREHNSNGGLDWRFELPEFLGPFDLLLQLLQTRQLDLSTASLAAVAHQFAEIVSRADDSLPLIETSEFAAVTAKLLTIKSAGLLPRTNDDDGLAGAQDQPEIDDPTDLTELLARYRELRSRASFLRRRMATGLRCFRRSGPRLGGDARPRIRISAVDLMRVLRQLAERDGQRLRERRVGRDTMTMARALRIIEERVRRQRRVRFSQLVAGAGTTRQLITFFLATLEICKSGKATMDQQSAFDEIYLSRAD
jgi:segregation and condensation protein A